MPKTKHKESAPTIAFRLSPELNARLEALAAEEKGYPGVSRHDVARRIVVDHLGRT